MKYSKLLVAGAAAVALGGCYSVPIDSSSAEGISAPEAVGYNSGGGNSVAGGTAQPGSYETGMGDTKAKGNTESAAK